MTLHQRVLATQLLELRRGHEPRVIEQQHFVGRRRDAHQRPHLRLRDFAAPQGIIDHGEFPEPVGDAYALARGDQIPADPPGEPVRTRPRALHVPAAARIELAQIGESVLSDGELVTCSELGEQDTGLRFAEPASTEGFFTCPACGSDVRSENPDDIGDSR
jgi:hypothetical protein